MSGIMNIAEPDTSNNPAVPVIIKDQPAVTYPNDSVILSGDISISAAGVAYTSPDVSAYSSHMIEVDTIGGTSFDVYGSIDGVNFVGPLRCIDKKTGALFAASPLTATGLFELEGKFVNIRVDLVGTGASVARILHGVK